MAIGSIKIAMEGFRCSPSCGLEEWETTQPVPRKREVELAFASLGDIRVDAEALEQQGRLQEFEEAVDAELTRLGLQYCFAFGLKPRQISLADPVSVLESMPCPWGMA